MTDVSNVSDVIISVENNNDCVVINMAPSVSNLYSRENVERMVAGDKVSLADHDDETNLDLFCFTDCNNDEDPFIKQCRGLIFHKDQLVVKTFSFPDEYNHTQQQDIQKAFSNFKFTDCKFVPSFEGTLLRLYYFADKWFLSTHKRIDAYHSKWGSTSSFGELFEKAIEKEMKLNPAFGTLMDELPSSPLQNLERVVLNRFTGMLDKSLQYMFLLRGTRENRFVCDPPSETESSFYFVSCFKDFEEVKDKVLPHVPILPILNFDNVESLCKYVESVNYLETQGVLCFAPDNIQMKIVHKEYQDLSKVRGNESSLPFRYLQLRMNKKMTDLLYKLYPDYKRTFDEYETMLGEIAQVIYHAYDQRFKKKNYAHLPREEYKVMLECHQWHEQDRKNNKVYLPKVIQILNKQCSTNLNKMIKRRKFNNLVKKIGGVPRNVAGSRTASAMNSPNIPATSGATIVNQVPSMSLK
jgi:hypothetical protein